MGKSTGCGLRPDAQGSRRNGGERPDVPATRNEQALSGGVPREDPTAIARDARPGSDRAVRRRGRPLRRQASVRSQRPERVHDRGPGGTNLAQITEAVLQDGYAIVQEFVDGGEDGDARIFLLEGQILERDGKPAAFRRVPTGNDPRANISKGGRSVPLEIGDVQHGIVEAMSEKLVADGMYFVGIDVIGDKVVEINAESPGGMRASKALRDRRLPIRHRSLERRTGSKS